MEGTPFSPEFSVCAMIGVVSGDKFTTYLELLERRPVSSLEKRRRGYSGILVELICNADAVDYVIKFRSSFNRLRNPVRNFTSVAEVIALQ